MATTTLYSNLSELYEYSSWATQTPYFSIPWSISDSVIQITFPFISSNSITINSATLYMYCSSDFQSYNINFKFLAGNTNHEYATDFTSSYTNSINTSAETWYSTTITSAVSNLTSKNAAWYIFLKGTDTNSTTSYWSTESGYLPYVVVDYTINYTACGYPSLVSVSNSTPDISSPITLSWSGAAAGTNNAITGYKIYLSTTSGGTYSPLSVNVRDVTTSESSGSFDVTSPDAYGNSYFYKVKTIGSVSGYDSDVSTAYAGITSTLTTACAAPTSISPSTATPEPNSSVTITWDTGTAGDNNSITGYLLYRDTTSDGTFSTLIGETDSSTLSAIVYSSINEGGVYYYRVKTKGSAGGSYYSPLSTVYATITSTKSSGACGAPATVSISDSKPEPLDSLTISWSGAVAGDANPITGYDVYEDSTENGAFVTLTGHVDTTETSGSLSSILASASYNITKYYRVKTIGTNIGYDSGLSPSVNYKTYLYADYGLTIPTLATLPSAINYIVVYYDDTNVYKVLDNTVLDVVSKETVLPCSGVYNVSTDHRYIVTAYSSDAYVTADKARALTESEQIFYLANGTTKTSVLNKQWTGTDWTTTLTSNNTSWSQAASSQIIQTADSISTKVSKGSIISEINQSAEAISINASKINLNGIVTANENFKILADGSMEAVNGKFGGDLTAEITYCNDFELRSGKEMTVGLWKIGSTGIYYPSGQGFDYLAFLYHGETAYVTAQAPMYLGPDYTNPLYISGNGVTFTITNNEYSAGFIQDYYVSGESQVLYQEICLVCNQAGSTYETAKGNLGTQTHRWDVLWVDTAHYNTHPSDSSILVKHDIVNLRDVGDIIDKVRTVEFKYNNDSADRTRFGLIYEELVKILPELCRQDDKTGEFGIEYDDFIAVLLKQAQESRKKEKELENRIKELEEKNAEYEKRFSKLEKLVKDIV